jgi:hypothetical protein
MFGDCVSPSNELDASDRARPFGDCIDRNTGLGSLCRRRCDGRIVVIKTQWYGTVRELATFRPLDQQVPVPIFFGEGRGNLRVCSHMHYGQKLCRAERVESYFRKRATITPERAIGFKPANLQNLGVFPAIAWRGAKISAEGASKSLMVLETDRQANVKDRLIRDLQFVSGLFQPQSFDVRLRRLANDIEKDALEMKRRVAVIRCQRTEVQVAIQIPLNIDQQWDDFLESVS